MPNIGIVSQARMTSSRLPGKVLLTANGITVLEYHLKRLAWSNIPVYVATTVNDSDQPITSLTQLLGIPHYCGDEHNVLQRFYECAVHFKLDVIIRVTSDCPLIDGYLVAEGSHQYQKLKDKNAYYSNVLLRTYPRGLDFEIFSFELLRMAYLNANENQDKEHVTPYIHQNKSKTVAIHNFTSTEDHSDLRWTLDTVDDWKLIKTLLEKYHVAHLRYAEILNIVQQHPELVLINNHIKQKGIRL